MSAGGASSSARALAAASPLPTGERLGSRMNSAGPAAQPARLDASSATRRTLRLRPRITTSFRRRRPRTGSPVNLPAFVRLHFVEDRARRVRLELAENRDGRRVVHRRQLRRGGFRLHLAVDRHHVVARRIHQGFAFGHPLARFRLLLFEFGDALLDLPFQLRQALFLPGDARLGGGRRDVGAVARDAAVGALLRRAAALAFASRRSAPRPWPARRRPRRARRWRRSGWTAVGMAAALT